MRIPASARRLLRGGERAVGDPLQEAMKLDLLIRYRAQIAELLAVRRLQRDRPRAPMRTGTIHVSPSRVEHFQKPHGCAKVECFAGGEELIAEMASMADGEIVRQKIIKERTKHPQLEYQGARPIDERTVDQVSAVFREFGLGRSLLDTTVTKQWPRIG